MGGTVACGMLHLLLLFVGCGFRGPCEEMCSARADCLQADIDRYDSTWVAFTGFQDRSDYEAECLSVFEDGREDDASRRDLRKVCQQEASQSCDP